MSFLLLPFQYAIIDWALAREDGMMFFDTEYFELSLLLQTFKEPPLKQWKEYVEYICDNQWEKLDFYDSSLIKIIHDVEDSWIEQVKSVQFSHIDKMKLGQYISRVIVGLNFAGKKMFWTAIENVPLYIVVFF